MTPAEFLAALRAAVEAGSDGDCLAAVVAAVDPEATAPTPEALAVWAWDCPADARDRTGQAVADLAEHLVEHHGDLIPAGWTAPEARMVLLARVTSARRLADVSALWLAARDTGFDGRHPLAPLVRAWAERPRDPSRRHLIATVERKPPEGAEALILTRTPGLLHLASLAAVEVDGEPFATVQPDGSTVRMRRYRPRPPPPLDLFGEPVNPYPRNLAGTASAGALVEAVADLALDGDERSPLRADVLRLGSLAYALTGAARLTDAEGAVLVGGRDTPANRKRFNRALWALRWLGIEVKPGIRWALADAEPGKVNRIGPPRWWLDDMRDRDAIRAGRKPPTGAPLAFRYTGGLFRALPFPGDRTPWRSVAVTRTIGGLEGALLWGASAGRGKRGRTPDNLRPVRKGGPGSEVFIPAWQVLRLAGENVGPDNWPRTAMNRYERRCEALEDAGYFTARTGTASAGDTVEIVERRKASPGKPSGLVVRASARWCAAYASGERVHLAANRLLAPPI